MLVMVYVYLRISCVVANRHDDMVQIKVHQVSNVHDIILSALKKSSMLVLRVPMLILRFVSKHIVNKLDKIFKTQRVENVSNLYL